MHILTAGSWTLYDVAGLAAASGLLPFLDPPPLVLCAFVFATGGKEVDGNDNEGDVCHFSKVLGKQC
jgi:hypothetical protein